jgi:hypothetical protein
MILMYLLSISGGGFPLDETKASLVSVEVLTGKTTASTSWLEVGLPYYQI